MLSLFRLVYGQVNKVNVITVIYLGIAFACLTRRPRQRRRVTQTIRFSRRNNERNCPPVVSDDEDFVIIEAMASPVDDADHMQRTATNVSIASTIPVAQVVTI